MFRPTPYLPECRREKWDLENRLDRGMDFNAFSFCPELQRLITTRQTVGRSGKVFEGVGALSSINNLFTIRSLCLELKPKRTLEIGFCFGGSGLAFAASHHDLGYAPKRQHTALDPFQASVWDDAGVLIIERAGLQGYLDFRAASSCIELPRLTSEKAVFNLVYIDGSHLFEDVFVDAYFVSKMLPPGGIVLFDDSSDPHVAKVLRFIRTNFSEILVPFSLDRHRMDHGNSLKYRLGCLLGRTQLTAFQKIGANERAWNASFNRF